MSEHRGRMPHSGGPAAVSASRPPLRHRLKQKPQPKRAKLPANVIAEVMNLIPAAIPGQPERHYGRKALPGQYTRSYMRAGHLTPGRVSKGCRKRYDRDHGTEGKLDLSESINARR